MRNTRSNLLLARTRRTYLSISTTRSSTVPNCHLLCMESCKLALDVSAGAKVHCEIVTVLISWISRGEASTEISCLR